MVDGVGIDMIEIARIRAVVDRWGARFLERVFTPRELAYCHAQKDPFPSLAARFAAKEAVMKAIGTGWGNGVNWKDIEVARASSGAPSIHITGKARAYVGARCVRISLSHTRDHAVAAAILSRS